MMSLSNIYIAQTNWDYMVTQTPGGLPAFGVWTAVLKFAMNSGEPTFSTILTVPGSVLNQVFSHSPCLFVLHAPRVLCLGCGV